MGMKKKVRREEIERWSKMKQTGVNLNHMMRFGSTPTSRTLLLSAQFLHRELPIRIARRVIDLDTLPFGLSLKPAVLKVRDWYLDSFHDLRCFPEVKDIGDELGFTKMIKMIKVRHNNVVPMIGLGVQQLKKDMGPQVQYHDEIHQFLDRFYMSRIGIRMLIGQHVAMHDPNPLPDVVGCIHTKLSPVNVARDASDDARAICSKEYGSSPKVDIYGDPSFTFPYVPTHLHLMVFELVKNSLRAVQERYIDEVAPPIRIIVADGLEDVTIKVCILFSFTNYVWSSCPLFMCTKGVGRRRGYSSEWVAKHFHISVQHREEPFRIGRGYVDRWGNHGRVWIWYSYKPFVCSVFWWRSANHLYGRIWD